MLLDQEQGDKDDRRDRQHIGFEAAVHDRQSLHRRQHRHGWSDDSITIEKSGRQNAEDRHAGRPFRFAQLAQNQRQQRHAAAFALIVGTHHDEHIFDRDEQRHRPEDKREHAKYMVCIHCQPMMAYKALLERIYWRSPDIAKDHAQRAQRQDRELAMRSCLMTGRFARLVRHQYPCSPR